MYILAELMRLIWLVCTVLAFAVALAVGCSAKTAEPPTQGGVVYNYGSSARGLLSSTITMFPARHRISAVSTLADRTSLIEEVQLDASGRVLEASASLAATDSGRSRKVVFDAVRGTVDVTTPRFHTRRHLPRDFPWVWPSLLRDPASAEPVATPLAAIIASRAASAASALRWIDSQTFATHTIMADQVMVPNGHTVTVVLGDDWADLTDGIPTRMHLAALQTQLLLVSGRQRPDTDVVATVRDQL